MTATEQRPRQLREYVWEYMHERNVQWRYPNGITISYVYRYGYVAEVWGWLPGSEFPNRGYITSDPLGVRGHLDAYETTNYLLARGAKMLEASHD